MVYIYPIDPQAMFVDRTHQFVSLGLPESEVTQVRGVVTDMWVNGPGGWVYEWSKLASRYADQGEHYMASLAYGCAKFPCLADAARDEALALQVKEYYFVPQADTLLFRGRPNTEVQLIPDTGHCAMSKLPDIMPTMIGWLRTQIGQR